MTPGDVLHLHVKLEKQRRGVYIYSAQALVDNEIAAEATMLCAKRDIVK